jgi:phosphoserine phosphatase
MASSKKKYLAAIDFDSTLIRQEIIDEIAKLAGKKREIAEITRKTVEGEFAFEESLRRRCAMLAMIKEGGLEALAKKIEVTRGAKELLGYLFSKNFFIAVVSGSLGPVADIVAKKPDFSAVDRVIFNRLEISGGKTTGKVKIRAGNDKGAVVGKLQRELGITQERTLSIGDGSTDIAMFKKSGLSIAFVGKPAARMAASERVDEADLRLCIPLVERWLCAQEGKSRRQG